MQESKDMKVYKEKGSYLFQPNTLNINYSQPLTPVELISELCWPVSTNIKQTHSINQLLVRMVLKTLSECRGEFCDTVLLKGFWSRCCSLPCDQIVDISVDKAVDLSCLIIRPQFLKEGGHAFFVGIFTSWSSTLV